MKNRTAANNNLRAVASFDVPPAMGSVSQGDALGFLKSLPGDSAEVLFLDPPFNLGKRYSKRGRQIDLLPEEEYRKWMKMVLNESTRVVSPGGALYLYHLPRWAMLFGSELSSSLVFQHWIAISMKNGFVRGRHLYPAHYALLMFTKGIPKRFERPKLTPQKCRSCGELIKDYGGYRRIIEEKGINLSDFWDDLSPVRHANRKNRSANELPSRLFERVIALSGKPGDLYVDPFVGAGNGVIAALNAGLRFAACDLLSENCRIVVERVRQSRSKVA